MVETVVLGVVTIAAATAFLIWTSVAKLSPRAEVIFAACMFAVVYAVWVGPLIYTMVSCTFIPDQQFCSSLR